MGIQIYAMNIKWCSIWEIRKLNLETLLNVWNVFYWCDIAFHFRLLLPLLESSQLVYERSVIPFIFNLAVWIKDILNALWGNSCSSWLTKKAYLGFLELNSLQRRRKEWEENRQSTEWDEWKRWITISCI